jgi:hypothetical protein
MYVLGHSVEERSDPGSSWTAQQGVHFYLLGDEEPHAVQFRGPDGADVEVLLRSTRALAKFAARHAGSPLYLDITGLGHHVWAPILRAALRTGRDVRVVYVEPESYKRNPVPTEGDIFDLSERIGGIAPIPGFASLAQGESGDFVLVALLGFEGARFAHVVENVQPLGSRLVPVVGVPGFRMEYPFFAYQGNAAILSATKAWQEVEYATANCPFALFSSLQSIAARNDDLPLKIAMLGTKPHSVGAVLYAISQDAAVELIYDHPVRKDTRTTGSARVSVYYVSGLVESGRV